MEEFLEETINRCDGVRSRMKHATLLGKVNATGNYTYSSSQSYGDRYLLVGDAYAFVDPIFSSGVFIAMSSGRFATGAVSDYLHQPEKDVTPFKRCQAKVRRGIKTVSWFIYRFNTPTMRRLFMSPRNYFRIEEAIVSMLTGDFHGDSPIRGRIFMFKIIYYFTSLKRLPDSLRDYLNRRQNSRRIFSGGILDVNKLTTQSQLTEKS